MSHQDDSANPLLQSASNVIARRPQLYRKKDLPHPYDWEVDGVIVEYMTAGMAIQKEFRQYLIRSDFGIFYEYSVRMAMLAVRRRNPELIVHGLVAVALGEFVPDYRDDYLILMPHYRSCEKLELDSKELFGIAARYADDSSAQHLIGFAEHHRTLKSMGWRELDTPAGLVYEVVW